MAAKKRASTKRIRELEEQLKEREQAQEKKRKERARKQNQQPPASPDAGSKKS